MFLVIALNMSTHVYIIRDSRTSASTKVLATLVVRGRVRVRVRIRVRVRVRAKVCTNEKGLGLGLG